MCKTKNLKPQCIHFKTNGKTPQDRKTVFNEVRFRTNQEIKFLYCKKRNLNAQLYQTHLDCANQCNNVRQHIQNSIDKKKRADKGETNYMQQLVILLVINCSSTCFGRVYAHRQEVRLRFTAYGVLSCCSCCDGGSGDKLCALHGVGCLT